VVDSFFHISKYSPKNRFSNSGKRLTGAEAKRCFFGREALTDARAYIMIIITKKHTSLPFSISFVPAVHAAGTLFTGLMQT
jgi:hypothetical protein